MFDVCAVIVFSYVELKADIDDCLDRVKQEDPSATEKELIELKGYMQEFMADVEGYKDVNFYEDLKIGRITPELLEWYGELNDNDEIKEFVDEAFRVLFADENELPLLLPGRTDIGKLLLEKRFRGILLQIKEKNFLKGHSSTGAPRGVK